MTTLGNDFNHRVYESWVRFWEREVLVQEEVCYHKQADQAKHCQFKRSQVRTLIQGCCWSQFLLPEIKTVVVVPVAEVVDIIPCYRVLAIL